MRRRAVLGFVLGLTGCGSLTERPYVERRSWPLVVRRTVAAPADRRGPERRGPDRRGPDRRGPERRGPERRGPVLLVRGVSAAPGVDTRGLQWLQRDGSLHVDYYEEWAVPPATSIESDLRQWLADSGRFAAVVAPGSRLDGDLVLEGTLTAFRADLPAGTARVALGLVLLDQRSSPAKILMQQDFSAETKLAGPDAPAIAHGLQQALAEVLAEIEAKVATYA